MLRLISALLLAAPAVAADQRGEAELAKMIGNRQPGPAVQCIDPQSVQSTTIVDGTAIVYRDGGRLYVNRPQGGADTLRRDDILVSHIQGGQLCRLDSITLFDTTSRIPHGFVILGNFVPYLPPR